MLWIGIESTQQVVRSCFIWFVFSALFDSLSSSKKKYLIKIPLSLLIALVTLFGIPHSDLSALGGVISESVSLMPGPCYCFPFLMSLSWQPPSLETFSGGRQITGWNMNGTLYHAAVLWEVMCLIKQASCFWVEVHCVPSSGFTSHNKTFMYFKWSSTSFIFRHIINTQLPILLHYYFYSIECKCIKTINWKQKAEKVNVKHNKQSKTWSTNYKV